MHDLHFHGCKLQRQVRYLVLNEDASKAGIHESVHGTLYVQSIAKTGVPISNHWECLCGLQAIPAVTPDRLLSAQSCQLFPWRITVEGNRHVRKAGRHDAYAQTSPALI